VAVGPNALGLSEPSTAAVAIVTTDGGATWNSEPFPPDTSGVNKISCADSTQCLALGTGLKATPTGGVQFVTSGDGGQTWAPIPPAAGLTSVASISCPAPNDCVAVGQSPSGAAVSTWQGGAWATQSVTQEVVAPS
jgi:photosystem II stability/assembly factor-like uncharacterized protein